MRIETRSLLLAVAVASVVLAGCSSGPKKASGGVGAPGDVPDITATSTTGGIHGFVVDQEIKPLKGVAILVNPGAHNTTTNVDGAFAVSNLEAGTYFIKASHPLYATVQQSVEVVAGVLDPPDVKLQLQRTIFAQPYITSEKFDGFIVCSAGHSLVGYSEECGEGVGTPCVQPPIPCGRVGGQANNHIQYDFYVDNPSVQTILVELNWEPTAQTAASGQLLTYVSTGWVCDPFCGGNTFVTGAGPSPLYIRADNDTVSGLKLNATSKITAFTWANPDTTDPTGTAPTPSLILNQPYQLFVTKSYYLPLPADWSLVKGDAPPF